MGILGEGNGGANFLKPSSYRYRSSDTEITCILLNTYSGVGFLDCLEGVLLLEILYILLPESQSIVGSTPTVPQVCCISTCCMFDEDVPGRERGDATSMSRLKMFSGGLFVKMGLATLAGNRVADSEYDVEERSRPYVASGRQYASSISSESAVTDGCDDGDEDGPCLESVRPSRCRMYGGAP